MSLTRNDIMTLLAAIRAFDLDPETLVALRKRLLGKELRHLGWQDDRGWFFRTDDIVKALEHLRVPAPRPARPSTRPWKPREQPRAPEGYVTMKQAATILSVSRASVSTLIKKGHLQVLRQPTEGKHPIIFVTQASVYAEADRREAKGKYSRIASDDAWDPEPEPLVFDEAS
jgi:hypothetical protein